MPLTDDNPFAVTHKLQYSRRKTNTWALVSLSILSYAVACLFLLIGFNAVWMVAFVWLPSVFTFRALLIERGILACCFDGFAILNLAYVYMLFDYIQSALLSIFSLSFDFAPISPQFFIAIMLGSMLCSLGPFLLGNIQNYKTFYVASLISGRNSIIAILANRLRVLFLLILALFILRLVNETIRLPLVQSFSFLYLLCICKYLPRIVNFSFFSIFIYDYIALFAILNNATLTFGNRTSALQPLFIVVFAYLISYYSRKSSIGDKPCFTIFSKARSSKTFFIPRWFLLVSFIVTMAIAFFLLSTITKFSGSSDLDLSLNNVVQYYLESNKDSAGLVLRANTANLLTSNHENLNLQFFQFYQLFGSFFPRGWFDWKSEYNVTTILYEANLYPQPLYYEPFLNQYADLGVFGPLFYAAFLILFHYAYKSSVDTRSSIALASWTAIQPLVIFSSVFFMQTPWHYARGSLFVMCAIIALSLATKSLRALNAR